jgi:uncharacterized protein (DUF58 family)
MADIPIEFLKHLRRIELRTNRLVEELFAGKYKSIFRGRGMDFEEVREYEPGDEIRYIDWNVSARQNRLFVKVFREERELTVLLAVDVSGSGDLGSGFGADARSKRELMAEVAAVLAFSATANNDRVGLVLFSDRVEKFIRPAKGRRHVLRVIRDILYYQPEQRGTDIESALRYIGHVVHRSSMVFLLSDFLDSGFDKAMRIANTHFDLIPILVLDDRERELPNVGWVALQDAETGEVVDLNTSDPRVRKLFAEASAERVHDFKKQCVRSGIEVVEVRSGGSYVDTLRRFFQNRMRRR